MSNKYEWRDGSVCPLPADVVGPELERIWRANGQELTPQDIVSAARPKEAALHPAFEWNDKTAAANYRLQQARSMTRSIRVVTENGDLQPLFVHVRIVKPAEDEQQKKTKNFYRHADVIVDRQDEYLAALRELRRQLTSLQQSVEEVRRLAKRHEAGDAALSKLGAIHEALATAQTVAQSLQ